MAAFGAGGGGPVRPLKAMLGEWSNLPASDRMPVVFVGHGTPMSAIQPNQWTKRWAELGQELVKPKAILSISAHWLTRSGALVTANDAPRMNYDMSGFPDEIMAQRGLTPLVPILRKPFAPKRLLTAIEEVLATPQSKRTIASLVQPFPPPPSQAKSSGA